MPAKKKSGESALKKLAQAISEKFDGAFFDFYFTQPPEAFNNLELAIESKLDSYTKSKRYFYYRLLLLYAGYICYRKTAFQKAIFFLDQLSEVVKQDPLISQDFISFYGKLVKVKIYIQQGNFLNASEVLRDPSLVQKPCVFSPNEQENVDLRSQYFGDYHEPDSVEGEFIKSLIWLDLHIKRHDLKKAAQVVKYNLEIEKSLYKAFRSYYYLRGEMNHCLGRYYLMIIAPKAQEMAARHLAESKEDLIHYYKVLNHPQLSTTGIESLRVSYSQAECARFQGKYNTAYWLYKSVEKELCAQGKLNHRYVLRSRIGMTKTKLDLFTANEEHGIEIPLRSPEGSEETKVLMTTEKDELPTCRLYLERTLPKPESNYSGAYLLTEEKDQERLFFIKKTETATKRVAVQVKDQNRWNQLKRAAKKQKVVEVPYSEAFATFYLGANQSYILESAIYEIKECLRKFDEENQEKDQKVFDQKDYSEALCTLARLCFERNELLEAANHLKKALRVLQQLPKNTFLEEAASDLEEATTPLLESIRGEIANILELKGKYRRLYLPDNAKAFRCLGLTYYESGDYARALLLFKEAIAINLVTSEKGGELNEEDDDSIRHVVQVFAEKNIRALAGLREIGKIFFRQGRLVKARFIISTILEAYHQIEAKEVNRSLKIAMAITQNLFNLVSSRGGNAALYSDTLRLQARLNVLGNYDFSVYGMLLDEVYMAWEQGKLEQAFKQLQIIYENLERIQEAGNRKSLREIGEYVPPTIMEHFFYLRAVVLLDVGNVTEAKSSIEEAVFFYRKTRGGMHPGIISIEKTRGDIALHEDKMLDAHFYYTNAGRRCDDYYLSTAEAPEIFSLRVCRSLMDYQRGTYADARKSSVVAQDYFRKADLFQEGYLIKEKDLYVFSFRRSSIRETDQIRGLLLAFLISLSLDNEKENLETASQLGESINQRFTVDLKEGIGIVFSCIHDVSVLLNSENIAHIKKQSNKNILIGFLEKLVLFLKGFLTILRQKERSEAILSIYDVTKIEGLLTSIVSLISLSKQVSVSPLEKKGIGEFFASYVPAEEKLKAAFKRSQNFVGVLKLLESPPNMVILAGPPGVGKTSAAAIIFDHYQTREKNRRGFWINASSVTEWFNIFLFRLAKQLKIRTAYMDEAEIRESIQKKLSSMLSNSPILLVLDDVTSIRDFKFICDLKEAVETQRSQAASSIPHYSFQILLTTSLQNSKRFIASEKGASGFFRIYGLYHPMYTYKAEVEKAIRRRISVPQVQNALKKVKSILLSPIVARLIYGLTEVIPSNSRDSAIIFKNIFSEKIEKSKLPPVRIEKESLRVQDVLEVLMDEGFFLPWEKILWSRIIYLYTAQISLYLLQDLFRTIDGRVTMEVFFNRIDEYCKMGLLTQVTVGSKKGVPKAEEQYYIVHSLISAGFDSYFSSLQEKGEKKKGNDIQAVAEFFEKIKFTRYTVDSSSLDLAEEYFSHVLEFLIKSKGFFSKKRLELLLRVIEYIIYHRRSPWLALRLFEVAMDDLSQINVNEVNEVAEFKSCVANLKAYAYLLAGSYSKAQEYLEQFEHYFEEWRNSVSPNERDDFKFKLQVGLSQFTRAKIVNDFWFEPQKALRILEEVEDKIEEQLEQESKKAGVRYSEGDTNYRLSAMIDRALIFREKLKLYTIILREGQPTLGLEEDFNKARIEYQLAQRNLLKYYGVAHPLYGRLWLSWLRFKLHLRFFFAQAFSPETFKELDESLDKQFREHEKNLDTSGFDLNAAYWHHVQALYSCFQKKNLEAQASLREACKIHLKILVNLEGPSLEEGVEATLPEKDDECDRRHFLECYEFGIRFLSLHIRSEDRNSLELIWKNFSSSPELIVLYPHIFSVLCPNIPSFVSSVLVPPIPVHPISFEGFQRFARFQLLFPPGTLQKTARFLLDKHSLHQSKKESASLTRFLALLKASLEYFCRPLSLGICYNDHVYAAVTFHALNDPIPATAKPCTGISILNGWQTRPLVDEGEFSSICYYSDLNPFQIVCYVDKNSERSYGGIFSEVDQFEWEGSQKLLFIQRTLSSINAISSSIAGIGFCGYLLGAFFAELSAAYCFEDQQKPARAVTFESPGALEIIHFRYQRPDFSYRFVTSYVGPPNFVNTYNSPVDVLYSLDLTVTNFPRSTLEYLTKILTIQTFFDLFEEARGQPPRRYMLSWPKGNQRTFDGSPHTVRYENSYGFIRGYSEWNVFPVEIFPPELANRLLLWVERRSMLERESDSQLVQARLKEKFPENFLQLFFSLSLIKDSGLNRVFFRINLEESEIDYSEMMDQFTGLLSFLVLMDDFLENLFKEEEKIEIPSFSFSGDALDLSEKRLTDHRLFEVLKRGNFQGLQSINLSGNFLTIDSEILIEYLNDFFSNNPNLKIISFSKNKMSGEAIEVVAKSLSTRCLQLEEVDFSFNSSAPAELLLRGLFIQRNPLPCIRLSFNIFPTEGKEHEERYCYDIFSPNPTGKLGPSEYIEYRTQIADYNAEWKRERYALTGEIPSADTSSSEASSEEWQSQETQFSVLADTQRAWMNSPLRVAVLQKVKDFYQKWGYSKKIFLSVRWPAYQEVDDSIPSTDSSLSRSYFPPEQLKFIEVLSEDLRLAGIEVVNDDSSDHDLVRLLRDNSYQAGLIFVTEELAKKHPASLKKISHDLRNLNSYLKSQNIAFFPKRSPVRVAPLTVSGKIDTASYKGFDYGLISAWVGNDYVEHLKKIIASIYLLSPEALEYQHLWEADEVTSTQSLQLMKQQEEDREKFIEEINELVNTTSPQNLERVKELWPKPANISVIKELLRSGKTYIESSLKRIARVPMNNEIRDHLEKLLLLELVQYELLSDQIDSLTEVEEGSLSESTLTLYELLSDQRNSLNEVEKGGMPEPPLTPSSRIHLEATSEVGVNKFSP